MSRVLAAWELGGNMGHIDLLLLCARALRTRGHEVHFVLRDLSRAHPRIAAEGFAMGQAPVWLPTMAHPPRLGNYAAVLAAAGWLDAAGLAGLMSGWNTWYDVLQPDVVITNHAPTAVLSARGRGFPVWTLGTSFEVPPRSASFPPMAWWDATERTRGDSDDMSVLPFVNQALALHHQVPLIRLTALFDGTRQALVGLRELAHYDGYAAETEFCGPAYVGDSGTSPVWPAGPGPRVFAYLSPTHPEFRNLMSALNGLSLVTLVHAKGLSADAARRLAGPRLRFEAQPLRMDEAAAQADIIVSHGGMGTVTAAAMAGKPQLAITTHMEQCMTGRRIASVGIGLAVNPGSQGTDWRGLLSRLSGEPGFAQRAQAMAARHRGRSTQATGQRLADLVEASLPGGV